MELGFHLEEDLMVSLKDRRRLCCAGLNMAMLDEVVEGNNEDYQEEESSAIVEHILKELRGINKIQEEISDLRAYLSSVHGSVDEVSSCVDAVLMEIECMRSGNKSVVETWPEQWVPLRVTPTTTHKSNNTVSKGCYTVESSSSCGDILSEYQVVDGKHKEAPRQSTFNSVETPKPQRTSSFYTRASNQRSDVSQGGQGEGSLAWYLERQDGQGLSEHQLPIFGSEFQVWIWSRKTHLWNMAKQGVKVRSGTQWL